LSTNDTMVNNVIIGPEFSSSDHRIITFNIKISEDKENISKEKVPDYQKADFNKLRTLLASANWNVIHTAGDINESWRIFTEILNQAVQSCVPLRNRRSNKITKPKWWNNQIKNSLLTKKRAYQKYSLTKDQNDKLEYERIRRETKKLIRESKKNLEIYIANSSKTNPKEFYGYVRKKKVLTNNIGPLAMKNGQHTDNENEMALTTIFPQYLHKKIAPHNSQPPPL